MKKGRQERILELITKYEVETQDDLMEMLRIDGYKVTQATISRDIRDLDLVKVATPDGAYKYVVSHVSSVGTGNVSVMKNPIVDTVISITCAQNIIVIKTNPGMAQAVGIFVDRMHDGDIVGCVAGDDTIIIVTLNNDIAAAVADKLKNILSL
ncbi:MAG: arginine repressor [Ruminococcaceae bacterium]|nr:arginine repressor [Oscillospiraceae bacterium]